MLPMWRTALSPVNQRFEVNIGTRVLTRSNTTTGVVPESKGRPCFCAHSEQNTIQNLLLSLHLLGLRLAEVLEAYAVDDDLGLRRQVVLAVRVGAHLAPEQQTPRRLLVSSTAPSGPAPLCVTARHGCCSPRTRKCEMQARGSAELRVQPMVSF